MDGDDITTTNTLITLRQNMLQPETVTRDKDGFFLHSAAKAHEETAWQDLPGAEGMEFTYRNFERDAPHELVEMYDRAIEDSSYGEADWCEAVRRWNPTPPEGEGWFLVGIYDTEDGPAAAFARPQDTHHSELITQNSANA